MSVIVTAVHMVGGTWHEHISSVRWKDLLTGKTGESTRGAMVEFIDRGGLAQVTDGRNSIPVGVVRVATPYIRTYADGIWTDNLLALPRF